MESLMPIQAVLGMQLHLEVNFIMSCVGRDSFCQYQAGKKPAIHGIGQKEWLTLPGRGAMIMISIPKGSVTAQVRTGRYMS